ncbi:hypothetical protein ACSQ76_08955 [Roseovarius sp. B08]|uniref:hypothetical protein n=1 Tax=Roseovarius sp. B08 TaxID=3449223 RepID=UPI003EDBC732
MTVDEILKRFRSAFFSRKRAVARNPPDRSAVAENDDLPCIFRDLKAAPVNLAQKSVHSCETLNVARLSYHTALLYGFGRKQVVQPYFRR